MNHDITFHAHSGLSFTRHDETGDVTIHLEGMSVRLSADTWISTIASMAATNGTPLNNDAAKAFHHGIGSGV